MGSLWSRVLTLHMQVWGMHIVIDLFGNQYKLIIIMTYNERNGVSQITSLTIAYSTVYSGADQRKHQSSASLAFVRGIHRWPVNSPQKGPVTREMFPFDDFIMNNAAIFLILHWESIQCYINTRLKTDYAGRMVDNLVNKTESMKWI